MRSDNLTDEMKRLSRRIDEQGKVLDLLMADREILEDILHRLSSVEDALHLQRSNQTAMVKDIKADIGEVKESVEAKVDELNIAADERTLIVKAPRMSVIQKILNKMKAR